MEETLRDYILKRRSGTIPRITALANPFFDLPIHVIREMPRGNLVKSVKCPPKIGEKSVEVILSVVTKI